MSKRIFREISIAVFVGAVAGAGITFALTQTILGSEIRENPRATTTIGLIAGLAAGVSLGFMNASRKEKVIYRSPLNPADELLEKWRLAEDPVEQDRLMGQIILLNQAEATRSEAQAKLSLHATTQATYAGAKTPSDQQTSLKRA